MKKQILVTGCSGFLGSKLIGSIDKKRYKLVCISRNPKNRDSIRYKDIDKTRDAVKKSDVIVHLAAITDPFDDDIWKVNADYTKFLASEAKRGNKRFIFISTQNVLFGKDAYSETKRHAEKAVKTIKNHIILRPTIIYGKGDNRYVSRLMDIAKRYPLVPVIGSGKNRLQPVYIEDIISIMTKCIEKNIRGTFLIAGKKAITYNYLMDCIISMLGLKRMKMHIPIWIIRPFSFFLQKLSIKPVITTVQLNNLKISKSYDVKNVEKVFNIKLKDIEEGLKLMLKK